ncbi:MAG: RNA-binding protein [Desulfobulbaceae bacterium A2]|nr:MAG: RNA-binding protein [Desulfobulbaceae bacterium A2]
MQELVRFIAGRLVDHPDAVQVLAREDEENLVVELRVHQQDLGKVIGKQGRTAKAIRALLGTAAQRQGKKARLDIVE